MEGGELPVRVAFLGDNGAVQENRRATLGEEGVVLIPLNPGVAEVTVSLDAGEPFGSLLRRIPVQPPR
jgi:hypothetical protein